MAIRFIVGRPGNGKTYLLVKLLRDTLLEGRNCYWQDFLPVDLEILLSPTRLEKVFLWFRKVFKMKEKVIGELFYYHSLEDFAKIENGVIFMDEAQMYFNSRKWQKLPDELQWKFQQHRHDFIDIWGATQNIKRIDTLVRELINSVFFMKKAGRLFVGREYDVADIDKEKKEAYSIKVFWFSWKIAKSYDTHSKGYKKAMEFSNSDRNV